MKCSLLMITALLIAGCTKPTVTKEPAPAYTIKGQLVESRSNPVPVSGYKLSLGQITDIGPLGRISDIDSVKKTDADGRFMFTYNGYNRYAEFVANQELNGDFGELLINGWDITKQNNAPSLWLPMKCLKNYDLDTIYLFKNIDMVVRKVEFKTALDANDSLEVITANLMGGVYSIIHGPVAAGSYRIDTIKNLKISVYNITDNNYTLRSALKKPFYQTDTDIIVGANDERYREITLTY